MALLALSTEADAGIVLIGAPPPSWERGPLVTASDMYLSPTSQARLGIGTQYPRVPLHIMAGTDADGDVPESGMIMVGALGGNRLMIDDDEIMARGFNGPGKLFLNRDGGEVLIGKGEERVTIQSDGDVGLGTMNPDDEEGVGSPLADLFVEGFARVGEGLRAKDLQVDESIVADSMNLGWDWNDGTHSDAILHVAGKAVAQEIVVTAEGWADDVFDPGYELKSPGEVEEEIARLGHLPGVPSADEVLAEGVDVGEMNAILLRKVEELTLYTIEQEQRIARLEESQRCK